MSLDEVNKKIKEIKNKLWNPEWDSMSENEKLKDPTYAQYMCKLIEAYIEQANEKKKISDPTYYDIIDEVITYYKELLKLFQIHCS